MSGGRSAVESWVNRQGGAQAGDELWHSIGMDPGDQSRVASFVRQKKGIGEPMTVAAKYLTPHAPDFSVLGPPGGHVIQPGSVRPDGTREPHEPLVGLLRKLFGYGD